MSVYKIAQQSHLKQPLFFGEPVDIQRYDILKYPVFDKLTTQQLGFFWRPEEIDLTKDARDFKTLSKSEEHIFTSNLKSQIMLDSIQGRSPNLVLLPIVSLPELETWVETWSFSETIHSRSYTHILRNVYPDPSVVFDELKTDVEINKRAHAISKYYDALYSAVSTDFSNASADVLYDAKKRLWLCLNAINALEGVRFYVSFACSWAFAENDLMIGNADIIRLICRDENLHLASTQQLLKLMVKDDKDFKQIQTECYDDVHAMFMEVAQQEREWAEYLFKDGSIIGLNAEILKQYVDYIVAKRMRSIGMDPGYTVGSDPLPWTNRWIRSGSVQAAPQEKDITSYVVGGIENDITNLESLVDDIDWIFEEGK